VGAARSGPTVAGSECYGRLLSGYPEFIFCRVACHCWIPDKFWKLERLLQFRGEGLQLNKWAVLAYQVLWKEKVHS